MSRSQRSRRKCQHFESQPSPFKYPYGHFKLHINSLKRIISRFFLIQNHNMAEQDVRPSPILIGWLVALGRSALEVYWLVANWRGRFNNASRSPASTYFHGESKKIKYILKQLSMNVLIIKCRIKYDFNNLTLL